MKTSIHYSIFFDHERFIADVRAYRTRQNISVIELASRCGMFQDQVRRILYRGNALTLATACIFAEVCDLSLDSYRKERETWTNLKKNESPDSSSCSVGRVLPWAKPARDVLDGLEATS